MGYFLEIDRPPISSTGGLIYKKRYDLLIKRFRKVIRKERSALELASAGSGE